ncbi:MAG: tRNA (N(6)-L-threonylcarbamoyladenosine(37)-C(2))-methylthiotransferase MtaB [Capsulimonadaceae bacterium]
MPTVAIANLGCKVNQYETDRIAESFEACGFTRTDFREPADVYVVNTCSVTADADKKSRHTARRAARQNPAARVVLTGCFAQLAIDTSLAVEGVSLLVPNSDKMRTASHVLHAFPDLMQYSGSPASVIPHGSDGLHAHAVFPESAPGGLIARGQLTQSARPRTRATLKVQDGCRHMCAFCSIPYTRAVMASRPLPDILTEARGLADAGVREVVVTGVCVGAYGMEDDSSGARLSDVLLAVADIPGIERVRLSSVQPIEVGDDIVDALASHPNIAPHLHLSLQSGDDTVLRRMGRPYDTGFFADRVARLRAAVPGIGLTTDVIVGFPGETEDLFRNTLSFVERMQFAGAHVFRYSPRRRTAAAERPDDVPPEEKETRHRRLTAVCATAQRAFAATLIGQTVEVIVEAAGARDGWLSGYTGNYVRVQFAASGRRGRIERVTVESVLPEGDAFGNLVPVFAVSRDSL